MTLDEADPVDDMVHALESAMLALDLRLASGSGAHVFNGATALTDLARSLLARGVLTEGQTPECVECSLYAGTDEAPPPHDHPDNVPARPLPGGHPDTWPGGTMHMVEHPNGWQELRREIVRDLLDPCFCDDVGQLPECEACRRIRAVLAIVDRLAAARGEPEPGLREAAAHLAAALGFHNKTPDGAVRPCLPRCVACAALEEYAALRGQP